MRNTRLGRPAAMLAAAALTIGAAGSASAVTFRFDTDPFANSTVLATPGRQFVGNELFIPVFDLDEDVIEAEAIVFGIEPTVNFFNGFAADLPSGGVNFIVLQDIDADGDATNGIQNNAALSANLIAAAIDTPGAGFFTYFNAALDLNRIVYSPDLSSPLSDLKIVARFLDQSGPAALAALPLYTADNFAAVPEPTSAALMLAGLGLTAAIIRRRRAGPADA